MPSTTIRLDDKILAKVRDIKPVSTSVSAYVRELIERDYLASKMAEAARAYREFLKNDSQERQAMEEWESAPLVNEVEPPAP